MKKFLSLVLALVMTMSLVTISAGAKDFTDADKVNYDEAIAVLSAVKVIDGYTDGSFKPQTPLNRGQAAKIICNLVLGPTTAAELSATVAPFSDVPANNIFAGYITYCANEGIICGYGDGTFRPTASLTGYAFLKMLLGALGYDAEIEGYNNPGSFGIQVAKQAIGIGLNKGLKDTFNGNKTVTREEACLYALNTLKATMVEYDQKIVANVNGAQVTVGTSVAQDVKWGVATLNDGHIKNDGFVQFAEKYFPKLELEIGNGIYGRPTNTWKLKKAEIGAFTSIEPTYVYTESTDGDDVYKDLGKVVCDEKEYDWTAYVNGVEQDGVIVPVKGMKEWAYTGEGTVTEVYVNDDDNTVTVCEINYYLGQVTKVKSDDDGEYITVSVLSKGANDLDDKTFYVEGFEEDDYVVFTLDENEDEDIVIGEVMEPQTVTGVVSRVEKDVTNNKPTDGTTGETYLKVDGEKHVYAEDEKEPAQQKHIVYDLENLNVVAHPTLDEEYVIYMDPNGYVLGFKLAEETVDQYLFVIDSDEEMRDWRAKVYLTDATKVTVDVDDDLDGYLTTTATQVPSLAATNKVDYSANGSGKSVEWVKADGTIDNAKNRTNIDGLIWKYSVSSKDVYSLDGIEIAQNAKAKTETQYYAKDGGTEATKVEINNGKAYVTVGADSFIVDKKTVFVDVKGEKVYTGYAEVPNVEKAEIAYVLDGRVAEVVFILDGIIYDEGSVYFMLNGTTRESFQYDKKDYWEYSKAYVNGEKTKLNIKYYADGTNKVLEDGTLYQVKKTIDEEYITEVKKVTDKGLHNVLVVGADAFWADMNDDNNFTTGVNEKFDVNEETVFVVVEKDVKGKLDKIYQGRLDDMDDSDYAIKVQVVKADDDTAELVYIYKTEISNDAAIEEITVATGKTSKGYKTIAEAIENPVVVKNMSAVSLSATGTGSMTKTIWDQVAITADEESDLGTSTTSTSTSAGASFTDWQYNQAYNLYLVKVTATSADGEKEVTRYVAVKPTALVDITVNITNARVEYNNKVLKTGEKITVENGVDFTIKVTPADGMKTTTVTYGSAQTGFGGVYDITAASSTTTLTVECSAT